MDPNPFALRVAEILLRPLTLAFLLLTAVVFSGPVVLLAAPAVVSVGSGVVSVFVGVLVAVDVVAVLVVRFIWQRLRARAA